MKITKDKQPDKIIKDLWVKFGSALTNIWPKWVHAKKYLKLIKIFHKLKYTDKLAKSIKLYKCWYIKRQK